MWRSLAESALVRAVMLSGMVTLSLPTDGTLLRQCRADVPRAAKSAREAAIAAALDQPTELDFAEQPLSDVVEYLQQRHQITVQLDRIGLSDAGVGSDTPITRSIKGISLESALDLVLSEHELTWMIHDEVLFITSQSRAETMIESRVYPVRDLVGTSSNSDYESLVEVLAQAAGDDGAAAKSIRIYRPAAALVITRPIVVHRRIEKLLKELRQAKAEASS